MFGVIGPPSPLPDRLVKPSETLLTLHLWKQPTSVMQDVTMRGGNAVVHFQLFQEGVLVLETNAKDPRRWHTNLAP